jgi:nickel-dependent lactate racemase
MRVALPYGEAAIEATVPDSATVLAPRVTTPLPDVDAAVRAAIARPIASPPLARIARRGQRACVVVSDVTRPVPNTIILPPVLEALESAGVDRADITLLIGTGLHRPSRADERERILGPEISAKYRIVDHDARDPATHRRLLTTARDVDVELNRMYLDADIRVVTGFVEPHLFAGYSGGGKAVLPAIAGAAAIMANHDARMVGHPKAIWCTTEGNPIFEEMRDVALRSDVSFCVNVTLDERKRISGVFAGKLVAAHDAAIAQAARQALVPIPHPYDIVIATNMGYPADLVLYQSVKGMSVAAQACATGGSILLVAECREGLGAGEYTHLLRSEAAPEAMLRLIARGETAIDQWQVQVQAMVQARCDVWLRSALPRETVEAAHLGYAADVDGTIDRLIEGHRARLGREPAVCVLPYGQLTVPRLEVAA